MRRTPLFMLDQLGGRHQLLRLGTAHAERYQNETISDFVGPPSALGMVYGRMAQNSCEQSHTDVSPNLTKRITAAALALGFCRVGFCAIDPLTREAAALREWLHQDQHGEMAFMENHERRDAPEIILQEARSLVVVAMAYARDDEVQPKPGEGFVGRYARGADYHDVLKQKLRQLGTACESIIGRPLLTRPCVDSAPLLERGYAARAGVGFAAKSTMVIAPGVGTYILLGELLLDIDLPPTSPMPSRCGQCTRCLDACPTRAFVSPYVLDARRCVSYLTVELQTSIPRELRPMMGNMVLGCDICQEVCPFNASPRPRPGAPELRPLVKLRHPNLLALLQLGSAQYRKLVAGTTWRRVSRRMLARNAAVAMGNSGDHRYIEPLAQALREHINPLVREHAAWALGRLGGATARAALKAAEKTESEASVQLEIRQTLADMSNITQTGA